MWLSCPAPAMLDQQPAKSTQAARSLFRSYDYHGAWPGEGRVNYHTPWVNPLKVLQDRTAAYVPPAWLAASQAMCGCSGNRPHLVPVDHLRRPTLTSRPP